MIRHVTAASRILNRLREAGGGIVSRDELIMAMYPDDDEPDSARAVLSQSITQLKRIGYPIRNDWGRGYYFAADPEARDVSMIAAKSAISAASSSQT